MDFKRSKLYGIKDIKTLEEILCANTYNFRDSCNVFKMYKCSISEDGKRLFEKPFGMVKELQTKVLKCLQTLELPSYYFSCKGQSAVKAVAVHKLSPKVIVKADIRKFYPSSARDKVYKFWKCDMQMSSSVAERITNITTISVPQDSEIKAFLDSNGISTLNHLPTGGPSSQILAFLINWRMFEEIYQLVATEQKGRISVYADDITVSGCENSKQILTGIRQILFSYGYRLSDRKSKIVHNKGGVEILGVILTVDGKLRCPNRINRKIMTAKENVSSQKGVQQYQKMINATEYHL